jgi:hypothetical protein
MTEETPETDTKYRQLQTWIVMPDSARLEFMVEHARSLERRLRECEELHRMQLAAIGVSAMCNTRETAAQQRIGRSNPYWTLALEDVYRAVDREMDERERADAAEMRYIAWG